MTGLLSEFVLRFLLQLVSILTLMNKVVFFCMATIACLLTPDILPKMKLMLSVILFQCIAVCKEATSAVHWKPFILLCIKKPNVSLSL